MRGNTITTELTVDRLNRTDALYQYDYGQRLIFTGVELPIAYEVHFSNDESRGNTKTSIGDSTGVDIPDEFLLTGKNVYFWLYLHNSADDGETEYHGMIPVNKRAHPTDVEPTPVQQSVIDQTIAALSAGVTEVEGIAEAMPGQIQAALQEAKDSGEFDGPPGFSPSARVERSGLSTFIVITDQSGTTTATVNDGKDGLDGVSPTAIVSKEDDTATIVITDKSGTTTATIKDGRDATAYDLIDDTAGSGTMDKTWSANKIVSELSNIKSFDIEVVEELPTENIKEHTIYFVPKEGSGSDVYDEYVYVEGSWELVGTTQVDISMKADKANTVLDTTLSLGRKANTTIGTNSVALGSSVAAAGDYSFATGNNTSASGNYAHAEGGSTVASGVYSHSEGQRSEAINTYAHAEGYNTRANGIATHAEGYQTTATGAHSHSEGENTIAYGTNSHAEGYGASGYGALGKADHAEGYQTKANSGTLSTSYGAHAEGYKTTSTGNASHSEGYSTTASSQGAHSEGQSTQATGSCAHSEGSTTRATGYGSHAEGSATIASGSYAHAEGSQTTASGPYSHAEGYKTEATGPYQHVFGCGNKKDEPEIIDISQLTNVPAFDSTKEFYPSGSFVMYNGNLYIAHSNANVKRDKPKYDTFNWHVYTGTPAGTESEWNQTTLYHQNDIVKLTASDNTVAYYQMHSSDFTLAYIAPGVSPDGNLNWHTQPSGTWTQYKYVELVGNGAQYTEGRNIRELDYDGNENLAGELSVVNGATIIGDSISRGRYPGTTVGSGSFAFGDYVEASGTNSHAEGYLTSANGNYSHAEGYHTYAYVDYTHAEGGETYAGGYYCHAEGVYSSATGYAAHCENAHTYADGENSHAEGYFTYASRKSQHVFGEYNVRDLSGQHQTVRGTYVEIVGNGTSGDMNRSNARALDWSGNEYLKGDVYVGCNADSTGGTKLAKLSDIPAVATTTETQAIITEYTGVSA